MENVLPSLNIHCLDGRIGLEASCDLVLSSTHLWHVNCPIRNNWSLLHIEYATSWAEIRRRMLCLHAHLPHSKYGHDLLTSHRLHRPTFQEPWCFCRHRHRWSLFLCFGPIVQWGALTIRFRESLFCPHLREDAQQTSPGLPHPSLSHLAPCLYLLHRPQILLADAFLKKEARPDRDLFESEARYRHLL